MTIASGCRLALALCLSLSLVILALGCGRTTNPVAQKDGTRGLDKGKVEDNTPSSAGSRQALVVGVTGYDNKAFSDLRFTENDADGIAEALSRKEAGFKVRLLTTSRGKKDNADAPTAANITKALAAMLKGRKKGDIVLIAFAGHGVTLELQDPDGKGAAKTYPYFCPADADLLDPRYTDGGSKTMVNLDDLFANLGKCGAGTKLVLMDACRNNIKIKASTRSFDAKSVNIPDGVAALYSCGRGQFAFEKDKLDGDKGHGIFFHFAIQALKGKARNDEGVVTWGRFSEYVSTQTSRQVPTLIGDGAKQTPASMGSLEGESPVLVFKEGQSHDKTEVVVKTDKDTAKVKDQPKAFENSIKMKLVPIAAGKFKMGSPESPKIEAGRHVDEHLHDVTITKPFYMGATEVTQIQWMTIFGKKNNPSSFVGGTGHLVSVDTDDFPVETVSWDDAVNFCKKLSELDEEKKAGRVYRLPTEAEWEYACRAGTETPYHFGDTFDQAKANCGDSIAGLTQKVAMEPRKPNPWGLHDMHGNVAEWCSDWYELRYYKDGPNQNVDPKGPEEGKTRVVRGGHYSSIHNNFLGNARLACRSAWRGLHAAPATKLPSIGFRVVCDVKK